MFAGLLGYRLRGVMRLSLVSGCGSSVVDLTPSTVHGVVMIFFLVMPVLVRTFGNWVLPLRLAAGDLCLPRVNNLRLWTMPCSLAFGLLSASTDGGPGCG